MKCNLCGSQDEQFPLLSGKPPHEKECESCGAELCPKCGHRRSAHRPYEYDCSRQLGENYLDEKRRKVENIIGCLIKVMLSNTVVK